MRELDGQRILLGVTGGIAAYKAADLVRRLQDAGAQVRVVMTEGAQQFVTAMTFQALSGQPVRTSLWDDAAEAAMGHIELARWASRVLIAPASADVIARLAHGLANDLLGTLCLATEAPIAIVPAMNRVMWANAATQANIDILRGRGVAVFGPAEGDQACGEIGAGRMLEPLAIVSALSSASLPQRLAGRKLLISAGPTFEDIDPVRFLGNRSSGKMGFALAAAAADMGADVVLLAGPVALPTPVGVSRPPTWARTWSCWPGQSPCRRRWVFPGSISVVPRSCAMRYWRRCPAAMSISAPPPSPITPRSPPNRRRSRNRPRR
jgi:phosphopantothenoylcysteine decarboxylase/phosphopantothenate--cysteine ligase